jgi:hypothetical protein
LQGLRKAVDMNVKNLMVFGDSEIVVRQVRNFIHCLSPHLKSYQTDVWNLMHNFSSFNINSIPRLSNSEVDLLANVASKLFPTEDLSSNAFSIELLFRPSIPDNVTNWRVFDDDQQIFSFLHRATILFSSSTPSDAKTSRLLGSSYPGNHCGSFLIYRYEYVSYLAPHMVTLEKFLHLNKDFPFLFR